MIYLPFSLIQGVKVSVVILLRFLGSRLQTPTPSADPAAMAAPNAVVSGMEGLTTKKQFIEQSMIHSFLGIDKVINEIQSPAIF